MGEEAISVAIVSASSTPTHCNLAFADGQYSLHPDAPCSHQTKTKSKS